MIDIQKGSALPPTALFSLAAPLKSSVDTVAPPEWVSDFSNFVFFQATIVHDSLPRPSRDTLIYAFALPSR